LRHFKVKEKKGVTEMQHHRISSLQMDALGTFFDIYFQQHIG
jgi:hypothetical protein